jgi:DNA-binding IclR family transcriptional regulator
VSGGSSAPGRGVTGRALDLLGAFDADHPRLSLTSLARRASLPLSTAHRLLAELEGWGALTRDGQGRYVVGRRLWELGLLAPVNQGLREVALPHLQDVHAATRDTVHLGVRDGITVLYVERLQGSASAPVVSRMGAHLPLHVTGVGKVLLAHAPPDVVDAALTDPARPTRHSVVDGAALRREGARTRERGWALTAQEMTLGASSLAVPVVDGTGTVVAALGVVVASGRRDVMRLLPVLQVAAAAIGRRLR